MSHPEDCFTALLPILQILTIFFMTNSATFPWPWVGGGDTEVPFRTERSTVTYSQCFDQLEVSGLLRTTVPWEVGTAS